MSDAGLTDASPSQSQQCKVVEEQVVLTGTRSRTGVKLEQAVSLIYTRRQASSVLSGAATTEVPGTISGSVARGKYRSGPASRVYLVDALAPFRVRTR